MSEEGTVSEQERAAVYEYLDMVASSHVQIRIEEIADSLLLQFGLPPAQARAVYRDWKRASRGGEHA